MTPFEIVDEMRVLFAEHAGTGIDHLDGEICRHMAESLAVYMDGVAGLEQALKLYEAAAEGWRDQDGPAPRSPGARRSLARSAQALDETVVLFPLFHPGRPAFSDDRDDRGGAA